MGLGDNLQVIRARNNITQEQLAERLEVSRQSVSKWESGVSYPEMNTLLKICELYQVSMDELLRGTLEEGNAEEQSRFEKHMNSFAKRIAGAVAAIIAAAGLAAVLDETAVPDNLSGALFMAIAVVAVIVLIVAGMEHGDFTHKYPVIRLYHTEQEIEAFDKKFIRMIAGAIGAILVGVVFLIAVDGFEKAEEFAGGIFLFLVAGAVGVMILAGIQRDIYHVEEYNKSNRPTKRDKKVGAVCGCIMLAATIVFLVWGFLGGSGSLFDDGNTWRDSGWEFSWLAFPVGGILCAIASLLISQKEDTDKKE